MIGRNKYQFLKSLLQQDLTEEEKSLMEEYEKHTGDHIDNFEYKKQYADRILDEPAMKQMLIEKQWLWTTFLVNFKMLNGKDFIQNPDTIANVKSVMLYFLKDESFFNCYNISKLSNPSFDKGLLIVGGFGNGKTATMESIHQTLYGIKGYHFRSYNANEVVKMFEAIKPENYTIDLSRKDFDLKMNTGDIFFDDIKTERDASNYGKVNLFREIFEIRSQRNNKTYLTCNYKNGHPGNLEVAIDEFSERYGERVYDRIYDMFNIIEFNGKSFRK